MAMFKTVKVNTFQKNFDSKYRDFMFSWNQGSFFRYLKNRVQWYLYPNIRRVSRFPLHLDIETTAKCNLHCPMCPRRHLSQERYNAYDHMDMALYIKLVDECAENNIYSIRLSWRGEVLINSNLAECIRYAKIVRKIPNVSFLSNGSLLKGELAEKIIDYGLDYLSISVDGLADVYDRIRYPLKFDRVYENLNNFQALKKKKGQKKPVVRVATLWPAIATNPKEYYEKISKVADKIVYNPLKDYTITMQDKESFVLCQFLWERLFVGYNGMVQPCSNEKNEFIIGDARKNSIKEIWHGDAITKLRKMHEKGRRLEMSPCNECSYGVDYEKKWKGRDWANWDPSEMIPRDKKGI